MHGSCFAHLRLTFSRSVICRETAAFVLMCLLTLASTAVATPTTISFYLQTAGTDAVFAQIVSDFTNTYPEIKVDILNSAALGIGNWEDTLLTLYAGGQAPDVIAISLGSYMPLGRNGLLADLSPLLAKDVLYQRMRPQLYTQILDRFVTPEGQLYALPVDINLRMLFYNREHFDEAGLSYPTDNWSFASFREAGRRLSRQRADGTYERWGIAGLDNVPSSWITWVHGMGGQVVDRIVDPSCSTFSQPATLAAVNTLVEMIHTDHAAALPGAGLFRNMASSMTLDWVEQIYNYEQLPALNYAIVPQPIAKQPYSAMGVRFIGVSSVTKEEDAAYRLVSYITMDPRAQKLLAARKVSWVRSVAADPELLNAPPNRNKASVLQAIQWAELIYPLTAYWTEMQKIYTNEMKPVFAKTVPVETAAVKIDHAINVLLGCADK